MYKLREGLYEIPKEGEMRVPGLVVANEELLKMEDLEHPLEQVRNVARLPGIVGYSIAMPDIHWGYGFPIGGVAAMDAEEGVISPGGVGYDINCGVRLALAPMLYRELSEEIKQKLLTYIFKSVPSGVGRGHKKQRGLSKRDYNELTAEGARWSVERGMGFLSDLDHCESHGVIEGADINCVSDLAMERGGNQLGSIGSGNHFVEIGEVETLLLPEVASKWSVRQGQTYILIHSGSRGFGHQVCQDTLNDFVGRGYAQNLPDRQLVCAPIRSEAGRNYFAAMASAANYAFNNRQQILHEVRQAFTAVVGTAGEEIRLLYDVAHNIAKFETYGGRRLCVHRKGATRAFGPRHPELAPLFQETGQPVLVPGDMGTASYLLVGQGNPITWCSCCHGAGRARSRIKSMNAWKGRDPVSYMAEQGVNLMATSMKTIAEEMPDAYKDVAQVVAACQLAGLAQMVARLKPHLVIKG
ncbi:MAG: RtcB family protein [Verrucomicrobia bacterium]|nr:RtcB family protein [Verrucomicrobiota bacterium]